MDKTIIGLYYHRYFGDTIISIGFNTYSYDYKIIPIYPYGFKIIICNDQHLMQNCKEILLGKILGFLIF